jgi:hypothetical protein
VWNRTLEDAVSRIGGAELANEVVYATALADLAPNLLAAAHRGAG